MSGEKQRFYPQISQITRIVEGAWVHGFHRLHGLWRGCGGRSGTEAGAGDAECPPSRQTPHFGLGESV